MVSVTLVHRQCHRNQIKRPSSVQCGTGEDNAHREDGGGAVIGWQWVWRSHLSE